jgi:hypothetical protein
MNDSIIDSDAMNNETKTNYRHSSYEAQSNSIQDSNFPRGDLQQRIKISATPLVEANH